MKVIKRELGKEMIDDLCNVKDAEGSSVALRIIGRFSF